eukprot:4762904-Lingulodinium_polyedra.AAC.1
MILMNWWTNDRDTKDCVPYSGCHRLKAAKEPWSCSQLKVVQGIWPNNWTVVTNCLCMSPR